MNLTKKSMLFVSSIILLGFTICTSSNVMAATTWSKVVDYGDAGYSETSSNWKTYNSPQAYNSSYRYLSREVGDTTRTGTANWETTVPYCGIYRVSVSFRRTENRSPDADYYVTNSSGGEDHYVIDQRSHTPVFTWELGQVDYYYKAGQTVKVRLDGTDDSWSDCSDAASWELIELQTCPSEKTAAGVPVRMLLLAN